MDAVSTQVTRKEAEYIKTFKVTKSNELIRNGKFDLSVSEQRIIFYLISKIQPDDDGFKQYEFNIDEFCAVCGISKNGTYTYLKNVIKNLRDKSVWIQNGDELFTFSWLSDCSINSRTGRITLGISPRMAPYLLQLKSNFTSYRLGDIIGFRSKYSTWFYDYIKYFLGIRQEEEMILSFDVEEIKEKNFCSRYSFSDLRKRVIEPALADITANTQVNAVVSGYKKKERKVRYVEIKVSMKPESEYFKQQQSDELRQIQRLLLLQRGPE